jgi:Flp pilus assembly protein TadD/ketosteroid isomerase-like protein
MKKLLLAASLFFSSYWTFAADLSKAEQLLNGGQADAALMEAEAVLANDPTNPDGRFIQGIALARMGRTDEAILVFKDLTADYREIPEPYNNLAVLLAQTGDYAGARDALEDAVKYHPNYTVAWENLADIYSVMATVAYEKVLQQDPRNQLAKQRLAIMNGTATAAAETRPAARPQQPAAEPVASRPVVANTTAAEQEINQVPLLPATPTAETAAVEAPAAFESNAASVDQPANFSAEKRPVMATISQWANAWAGQDADGYIDAYGSNFQPQDNMSRNDWEKARRSRLASPSSISLQVKQPTVSFLDSDLAIVKFVQHYRSDSYKDTVKKTLLLEREAGNWRIVREQSIR